MTTSLTERIRAINRINHAVKEEDKEEATEQSLVAAVEQSWEEAQAEEEKIKPVVTLEMVYLELQALTDAVSQQAEELKKINKHINATQKMLKKGVK